MCTKVEEYNVECIDCGQVWQPSKGSKAWWYAKQYTEKYPNQLSAPVTTAKICGCQYEELKENPDAPYRVFGYNDLCEEFNHGFYKFTDAVRLFRELEWDAMSVVFISGVSDRVERAIRLGIWTKDDTDEMAREYHAASMADQMEFDRAVDDLFGKAEEQVAAGKMPADQLRQFFIPTS